MRFNSSAVARFLAWISLASARVATVVPSSSMEATTVLGLVVEDVDEPFEEDVVKSEAVETRRCFVFFDEPESEPSETPVFSRTAMTSEGTATPAALHFNNCAAALSLASFFASSARLPDCSAS